MPEKKFNFAHYSGQNGFVTTIQYLGCQQLVFEVIYEEKR